MKVMVEVEVPLVLAIYAYDMATDVFPPNERFPSFYTELPGTVEHRESQEAFCRVMIQRYGIDGAVEQIGWRQGHGIGRRDHNHERNGAR